MRFYKISALVFSSILGGCIILLLSGVFVRLLGSDFSRFQRVEDIVQIVFHSSALVLTFIVLFARRNGVVYLFKWQEKLVIRWKAKRKPPAEEHEHDS